MQSQCPTGPRRRLQCLTALVGLVMLFVPAVFGSTVSAQSSQSSQDVADEILRVQDQADRLAEAWAKARDRVDDLDGRLADAKRQLGAATARYAEIERALTKLVVDRYTGKAAAPMVMFTSDPEGDMEREALSQFASEATAVDLDEAETLRSELRRKQTNVDRLLADSKKEAGALSAATAAVERQLDRLDALRARLEDAEVRRAYEAKVAAQRAEADRRQAKADAAQSSDPTADQTSDQSADQTSGQAATPRGGGKPRQRPATPTPTSPPGAEPSGTTRPARPDRPETTKPDRPETTKPTKPDRPNQNQPEEPTQPTQTTKPKPDPKPEPSTSTTKPTKPDKPTPPPTPTTVPKPEPPPPPRAGILCPVRGASSFSDWWHAPRPGGRVHLGLDMMARTGTPVVAVVGGYVTMKTMTLGGLTASLVGNDGNRYFMGHFSAWEGGARRVSAGDVIGYVGSTGQTNASHLHFEFHPGGGPAANPYSMVKAACR